LKRRRGAGALAPVTAGAALLDPAPVDADAAVGVAGPRWPPFSHYAWHCFVPVPTSGCGLVA
jgi:hypothetical protein